MQREALLVPREDAMFEFLPAIDLRGGNVVRLVQGDYDRETVYASDPAGVASELVAAGARWLHVVDLDGARDGRQRQADHVRRIVERAGERVRVEVAGALRDGESVARSLAIGAARVVLGTAALRDPSFAGALARQHGTGRIAVALDVRGGAAIGHGWQEGSVGRAVAESLLALAREGIETFEVTAIDRDGLLGGPDLELLERLVRLDAGSIIASGGIASLDDLVEVRSIGCAGAIVGRAIYEGRLAVADALKLSVE